MLVPLEADTDNEPIVMIVCAQVTPVPHILKYFLLYQCTEHHS
jgi:hypothetical protein